MNLWFSLFDRRDYEGPEPPFYNTTKVEFTKIIEANYLVIKSELFNYLKEHQLQSYFNSSMVEKQGSWKTVSLRSWDINIYEHYKFFPNTLKIINSIDGLVSASFNKLEPYGKIKPHCGDTNGIFRCHLGLDIPEGLPNCGFRVKEEWRCWEEGKLIVFVDSNNHEAINLTNKDRFIFLFDVIRPEFITKKRYICSTVLTSLFLQKRVEHFPFLYKSPLWAQQLIGHLLTPFAFIAARIRNLVYSKIRK